MGCGLRDVTARRRSRPSPPPCLHLALTDETAMSTGPNASACGSAAIERFYGGQPPCRGMLAHSTISSTSMPTSVPRPQILFIDGLPGSGKSTAATAVGGHLPDSPVFAETAPDHPSLVAGPDPVGAAFADIHEIHSADSFAAAALGRLEAFLESAGACLRSAVVQLDFFNRPWNKPALCTFTGIVGHGAARCLRYWRSWPDLSWRRPS